MAEMPNNCHNNFIALFFVGLLLIVFLQVSNSHNVNLCFFFINSLRTVCSAINYQRRFVNV